MQHGQPFLDYSEDDLEVSRPIPGQIRQGDLIVLREGVRFDTLEARKNLVQAARQIGKTRLIQSLDALNNPDFDEVGIVINCYHDSEYIEIIWCRKTRSSMHLVEDLSVVQRA